LQKNSSRSSAKRPIIYVFAENMPLNAMPLLQSGSFIIYFAENNWEYQHGFLQKASFNIDFTENHFST